MSRPSRKKSAVTPDMATTIDIKSPVDNSPTPSRSMNSSRKGSDSQSTNAAADETSSRVDNSEGVVKTSSPVVNSEVVDKTSSPVVNNEVVDKTSSPVVNSEVVDKTSSRVVNSDGVDKISSRVVNSDGVDKTSSPVVNSEGVGSENVIFTPRAAVVGDVSLGESQFKLISRLVAVQEPLPDSSPAAAAFLQAAAGAVLSAQAVPAAAAAVMPTQSTGTASVAFDVSLPAASIEAAAVSPPASSV